MSPNPRLDAEDTPVDELASLLGVEIAEEDKAPGKKGAKAELEDWLPRLNPTQMEAFNDPSDVVAYYGPKYTGKSIGAGHKIIRHLFEEWDALYLILGASYSALSEGICHDINNLVLPTWRDGNREPPYIYKGNLLVPNPRADELLDNGIGLEFTPWKLDPATKHMYCRVQNRFGGWSRIRAMSIPYAKMVEARIKGPAPSGVYLEEATDTDGKEYFTYPSLQLYRRRDIVGPQQYLLSCNPKKPSWVYDWLYQDCVVETGGRVWPNDKEKPGIRRDAGMAVYFVPYEENRHNVNQKNREKLETELRSNPILKARLVDGLWVEMPDGEALFKAQFSESKHIFGNRDLQRGLAPVKGYPIILGYDVGIVHTAVVFMQCIETVDGPLWIVFDELCFYSERVPTRRLTRALMEKMAYWQRRMEYQFEFKHIADDQATTHFNPSKGSVGARDLLDYSSEIIREDPKRFEGLVPIRIVGCPKPPGSIETRANLVMDVLHTSLIAISAQCKWVKSMMFNLPRAKDNPMEPANPHRYKHTFDALTYPMFFRRYVQTKGFIETSKNGAAVSVSVN